MSPESKARKKTWSAAYHIANREKVAARGAVYRRAHPEKGKAARKRFNERHPERVKAQRLAAWRRWRERRPDLNRLASVKSSAGNRNLQWGIPQALGLDLITDACFYCGASPGPVNGIDRVDNSRGYTEDNVVSCCFRCNEWKRAHKVDDFLGHCQRIAARHSTDLLVRPNLHGTASVCGQGSVCGSVTL